MILVVRLKCESKYTAYKHVLSKKMYLKCINPLKDISSTLRRTRITIKLGLVAASTSKSQFQISVINCTYSVFKNVDNGTPA